MESYGSFVIAKREGSKLELFGLKSDLAKLPRDKNDAELATGSIAYCVDSRELYIYESTSGDWYLQ